MPDIRIYIRCSSANVVTVPWSGRTVVWDLFPGSERDVSVHYTVQTRVAGHQVRINPLTPNDRYWCRTPTPTSKRCVLYIFSTNTGTEYFKHGIYCPFFSLQNAVCFIILMYLVPVFFTFYIQGVLKLKKNNSGAKRLRSRAARQLDAKLSLE